jgi:sugar lactone lactonase YvrE
MIMRKKMSRVAIILLFITSLTGAEAFAKRSHYIYNMVLQPYQKTSLYVDNKKIRYRIIKRDNTLAYIRFYSKKKTLSVTVKHAGYNDKTLSLTSGTTAYGILDRKGSRYEFVKLLKTGKQPKSVTFIDKQRVCLPLLADTYIEILNIETGESKKIAPPKKWAKKIGFVESLVLLHKNELWVSQMTTGMIHIFNLKTLAYERTIQTSGGWNKVMLYNPKRNEVYLTNWLTANVTVINPDTYKETGSIDARGVPRGIILSNDNDYAYVCQYYGGNPRKRHKGRIVKIDLATKKIIKKMGSPGYKRHMVKDRARNLLYVSDMGTAKIYVYNLENDKLIKSIKVYSHPNTIQLSPDNRYLYVSCRGPNNPRTYLIKGFHMGRIYVIDTKTLKVVEWWEGGNQCTGLDISEDGRSIVFSDFLDRVIRIYRKK